jgi:hypothetical protein
MNRERDVDQILKHWLADGADRAPERFVWAALEETERIAQRGARQASLEGFLMKFKTAAPFLGVAAVAILALAAYQLWGPGVGGSDESASPTPRAITAGDLPSIVLSADLPTGWTLEDTVSANSKIILYPTRSAAGSDRAIGVVGTLVGGQANEFSGPAGAGAYVSWVALFDTAEHAQRALEIYLPDFESADGWGLEPATLPALGDESHLFSGATHRFVAGPPGTEAVPSRIYIWRVGTLLLAAGGFFDYDEATLRSVALEMDARTH